MAVRADDHAAAAGHLFTHVLMDDGNVGRYEDAAVFLGCRQAEDVVIFIDGTADGTKRIMTVRQYVGKGEFSIPDALAVWMMPTKVISWEAMASNLIFKCSIEPDVL